MRIPDLVFMPHIFADESIAQLLRYALAIECEANAGNLPEVLRLAKAQQIFITEPRHTPSQEPAQKERVQFKTQYAPRPVKQELFYGNCKDLIKGVGTDTIDCIITDPPYSQGQTSNGQRGSFEDLSMVEDFFMYLAQEYARVLTPEGEGYCFIDWRGFALLYKCFSPYLAIRNLIVWDKLSGAGNHYGFSHEFIIFFTKKTHSPNKAGMNVWRQAGFGSGAKKTNGEKILGVQKPIEIIETIIQNGCPKYGTILDTFAGTNTTGIAARRQARNYIGFEHNAHTFQIACERSREEAQKNNYFCTN